MAERDPADRLDDIVDAIVARGDATAALRDPGIAPLARIAADLRHFPSPAFKLRLRSQLQRRMTMAIASIDTGIREGFATVTPYIRVGGPGLVDFLAQTFDAQETFSGHGSGGGVHREVRIGDSMLMIGEGVAGGGDVMPIRPMAFHVFVNDVDTTFARAIAAGATSLGDPADRPYGERAGFVRDRFGNQWFIATPLGAQSLATALRTVTPALHVEGAADYVEFLRRALGAIEEMRAEGPAGSIRYARLRIGDAAIELADGEAMPGSFMLYVGDPDGRYRQALDAGATSIMPPTNQPYGRVGGVEDSVGNQWFFASHAAASR